MPMRDIQYVPTRSSKGSSFAGASTFFGSGRSGAVRADGFGSGIGRGCGASVSRIVFGGDKRLARAVGLALPAAGRPQLVLVLVLPEPR
jgi:hypothetical protein